MRRFLAILLTTLLAVGVAGPAMGKGGDKGPKGHGKKVHLTGLVTAVGIDEDPATDDTLTVSILKTNEHGMLLAGPDEGEDDGDTDEADDGDLDECDDEADDSGDADSEDADSDEDEAEDACGTADDETVSLEEDTEFKGGSADDLQVGDLVRIDARRKGGTLIAERVRLMKG